MALGCLLLVSWICFLLFDSSAGSPAIKGFGYPYMTDSRNLDDDDGQDVLTSPTSDENNWQASNSHLTDPVYTGYKKPSVAQHPVLVPTHQKLPNTPRVPEVERLVNGDPRDWGLENADKPLIFPLKPNYQLSDPAKPQPWPMQPRSAPHNVVSSDSIDASPSTGGAADYASTTVDFELDPSDTSHSAKSPSFDSWQPEPVSSGYGVADSGLGSPKQDFNTGSNANGDDSSNIPRLVFEEVFQYPSENTEPSPSYDPSFPSSPTNVESQPVYASAKGRSFSGGENLDFGQTSYQPRKKTPSWVAQKPVADTQAVVSQRVSEPIPPPPPPSSYIIQSRNGYQRGRYLLAKSSYLPEFPPPMPVSSTGIKRPATSQPASPKGVKDPQRTKW
ncbi:DNA-directed RNA polymerase II subunit RPB1-like [Toxotes jaculatrix]|uniref:DNA-directed RNA polymerase II subunit RPB1-like n=1 Tax=Toxotes jaculatrix TaxID=941984 RepID=UPI001B3B001A|nr:DNA-directed RNA polymerase II subunit RPB1-like [Toxotes jaculatrix]